MFALNGIKPKGRLRFFHFQYRFYLNIYLLPLEYDINYIWSYQDVLLETMISGILFSLALVFAFSVVYTYVVQDGTSNRYVLIK